MEYEITITKCDVCGKSKKRSYSYLQSDGWTKYKLFKDFSSGEHSGVVETKIIVCNKCDSLKGMRYFFFKILKPFVGHSIKVEEK